MTTIDDGPALSVEQKRRVLERLLRDRLARRAGAGDPLSVGQESLWFMSQLEPDSGAYNIGHGLALGEAIDVGALQAAIDRLVERHPALRSTFRSDPEGRPRSHIDDGIRVPVVELDGGALTDQDVVDEFGRAADRPFDLRTGPLLRIVVCRRSPDRTMLLLVLHHIVGEFWTLVVLVRDLFELYHSVRTGVRPNLPELPVDYADFARWQRAMLQGPEAERLAEYWRGTLAGPIPVLELPTDRPRPPQKSTNGALFPFDLGADLARDLKAYAAGRGVTLYTVLIAAFGAFLGRYSGRHDIVIGTPVTGRTEAKWADVVGFFDNPLPIRIDLGKAPVFDNLVADVHRTVIGALTHQAMPFARLVETVLPDRDPARSPLFDVMFVLRRAQFGELQTLTAADMGEHARPVQIGHGLTAVPLDLARHGAQFDLSLSVTEIDGTLHAVWEYNRDLFDATTVERMSGHLRTLLTGLLGTPGAELATVPLLSAAEQQRALVDWNATAAPRAAATLIDGFLDQVRRHPNRVALVSGDSRLTYAELHHRAARIAGWLVRAGARPNTLVAVIIGKRWEQIAGVLGVLMAGAAYLPLDPRLPEDRIRALLEIGEVELVLTVPDLDDSLAWTRPRARLAIDDHLTGCPEPVPAVTVCPDHLAYVIFTSGSTGVPKGVAIDHAGAVNTVVDINERFAVGPEDRVLGLSSLSFDLSVYDIFGILAAGAALVLPDAESLQDPRHWLDLVRRERITLWNSVPMLFKLLIEELDQDRGESGSPAAGPTSLRLAMLSGDWIPVTLPGQAWRRMPDLDLISLGGATEASIWSILHRIVPDDAGRSSIPYGRPLQNQQMHVLDAGFAPCPVGVTGRLYIGGVGLAREYWRDEARTGAAFPISPRTGERLYHTGDLARYLPDGTIEFLGRADHQVKVRGFRVELGEVEATLLSHPMVREAAVSAHGRSGENRLIGYVVAATGADPADLRAWCAARLPDYMVPAAIITLGELPLSGNGKVDRARLPDPDRVRRELPDGQQEPRNDLEHTLAAAWTELLRISPIGRQENFFELGGDSVQAMRLCTRLRAQGVGLTPRLVFEHPTIAGLAGRATLSAAPTVSDTDCTGADPDPAALGPMQQTMLLHKMYDTHPGLYLEHVVADLHGHIEPDILGAACRTVAERHRALRLVFEWQHVPAPRSRTFPAGPVTVTVLDWTDLTDDDAEAELQDLVARDRASGLDLSAAPPLTWRIARRGAGRWTLVWTHSHLVVDGWSITLVLRDLLAEYRALASGTARTAPLPPQYADYLSWLARRDPAPAKEFWQRELLGFRTPTALPVLAPVSSTAPGFRHGQCSIRLPAARTDLLGSFARSRGLTIGTVLQASWGILLARYSGEADVLFGVTMAGRPADLPGVEDMVGLFINTVPLRLHVPAATEVADWLADVQQRQVRLTEHEHISLTDIESWSEMPRSSRSFSLFDTILVVENYPQHDDASDTGPSLGRVRFEEQSNTPLMIYAIPGEGELELRATFDASRMSSAAAARLLGHLEMLLVGIATAPDTPVRKLVMLSDAELQALPGPRPADAAPPPDAALHLLVAAAATSRPDAIAVAESDRQTTYRTLWSSVAAEADRLRALGCGPGSTVAVLVRRSAEVVLAQLAVLASGAAFVPLDPAHPARSIESVTADAGVRAVLADPDLLDLIPPGLAVLSPRWQAGSAALPAPDTASARRPAYVIYTSGSTGRPKGVVIDHGAACGFVAAAARRYGIGPGDRVLQFCSLAFDASIEEIYPTLAVGATLVPRTPDMIESIPAFLDGCARAGITVLDLPTAFWHELVLALAGGARLPSSVRLVVVGGERMSGARLAQWRRCVPRHVQLFNTYGPTEATVVATAALVAGDPGGGDGDEAAVPIGSALDNTTVHVVDLHGQPTPVDVPGELLIGGNGLARGYLGRPELTERGFGPHPGNPAVGRVYRTGDLASRSASGELVYGGRRDDQVKISGFRVEPAGIESALLEHPQVRDAVVTALADHPDGPRLVAHLIAEPGSVPTDRELREFLAQRLPAYQLPSGYAWHDRLPRTPSGKIDRRSVADLPAQLGPRPADRDVTPMESTLLDIWSSVLGRPIGPDDNFFDVGGQSLQTLQLVQRMSGALGVDVPVREVFLHPTVAELAHRLSTGPEPATEQGVSPVAGTGATVWTGEPAELDRPSLPGASETSTAPFMTAETRPLLDLFAAGLLEPADSAALTYLPADVAAVAGIDRRQLLHDWCHGLPLVHDVLDTPLGRLAMISVPRFSDELSADGDGLVEQLAQAVRIAGCLGAKAVSLTGLIPSVTGGAPALTGSRPSGGPRVTTGQSTTAAAVTLNVGRLLADTGRSMRTERLAVLGVGSIGSAALRLLLDRLPHPAELILCDVYRNAEGLAEIRRDILEQYHFHGKVRVLTGRGAVPDDLYRATVVVGASNTPDVLDVERLAPGTLVVDDSAPHCFSTAAARSRMDRDGDILVTEGGFVESPEALRRIQFWPASTVGQARLEPARRWRQHHPTRVTGCMLAGLLEAREPATGSPASLARAHLRQLEALGFTGAAPHTEHVNVDSALVADFRRRFGHDAGTG